MQSSQFIPDMAETEVDIIASGYEWVCPACGQFDKEIEVTEEVTCISCHKTFKTRPPEHAYGA